MNRIIDGHLDLAWNALAYDRDQTLTIHELRAREVGITPQGRGQATVSLPEMRRANIALCFASLLARARPLAHEKGRPKRISIDHASQDLAHATAHGQLAYYRLLEQRGQIKIIENAADLEETCSAAQRSALNNAAPIGLVISMEGADPITHPDQITHWWDQGLRIVGLAHIGPGIYAHGTPKRIDTPEGLNKPISNHDLSYSNGRDLLNELGSVGMTLDLTHTSDAAFFEAIEHFSGNVLSSHTNCRALVPGPRQFSDKQIRLIAERNGVLGVALEASMLVDGWTSKQPRPVQLKSVVDHIDHICQVVGDAKHVAIGSDLDGGFGPERCPNEINTIADLQKLPPLLAERGFARDDIAAILHQNWHDLLSRALPTPE